MHNYCSAPFDLSRAICRRRDDTKISEGGYCKLAQWWRMESIQLMHSHSVIQCRSVAYPCRLDGMHDVLCRSAGWSPPFVCLSACMFVNGERPHATTLIAWLIDTNFSSTCIGGIVRGASPETYDVRQFFCHLAFIISAPV